MVYRSIELSCKIIFTLFVFSVLSTSLFCQGGTFVLDPSLQPDLKEFEFDKFKEFAVTPVNKELTVEIGSLGEVADPRRYELVKEDGPARFLFVETVENPVTVSESSKGILQVSPKGVLGQMDIIDIESTVEGLWILTRNQGLFFKKDRVLFSVDAALFPDKKKLRALQASSDGGIFLLGADCLIHVKGREVSVFTTKKQSSAWSGLTEISGGSEGLFWITNTKGQLFSFEGGEQAFYKDYSGIGFGDEIEIEAFEALPSGDLWIISSKKGLFYLSGTVLTNHKLDVEVHSSLADIQYAEDGGLWFVLSDTTLLYKSKDRFIEYDLMRTAGVRLKSIVSVAKGHLLLFDTEDQVIELKGSSLKVYKDRMGFPSSVLLDHTQYEGDIILAFDQQPLCHFKQIDYSYISFSDFRGLSSPLELVKTFDGQLLVSFQNAISYFSPLNDQSVKILRFPSSSPLNDLSDTYFDVDSRVWMAPAEGGLYCLKNGRVHKYLSDQLDFDQLIIDDIIEDEKDGFWMLSSDDQLIRLSSREDIAYSKASRLGGDIHQILQSREGMLYLASDFGLFLFDGKDFFRFNEKDGLYGDQILSMAFDNANQLWILTELGLFYFDGSSFTKIDQVSASLLAEAHSLFSDRFGRLWLVGRSELLLLTMEDGVLECVESFGALQGFKMGLGSAKAIEEVGDYLFGLGPNGLNIIRNENRKAYQEDLNISFAALEIRSMALDFALLDCCREALVPEQRISKHELSGILFDSLSVYSNLPLGLRLPSSIGHVVLKWNSKPYTEQLYSLSFQLNGSDDKHWVDLAEGEDIILNNLSWGNHRVLLRALDANGETRQEIQYEFSIDRPWYLGSYMFIIYFLLFSLIVYRIIQNRLRVKEMEAMRVAKDKMDEELKEANAKNEDISKELNLREEKLRELGQNLMDRNQILEQVQIMIRKIRKGIDEGKYKSSKDLDKELKGIIGFDAEWEKFLEQFEAIHGNFLKLLKERYPELTARDLKICALTRSGLNSKQISSILYIQPDSVKKSKYRINRKIGLENGASLFSFLEKMH